MTLIGNVDDPTEIKRYRDVIRKADIHGDYVIIGVEHQSTFDKNMIFRILNYDATTYINQVESKKEVYPVGNFVFYTGDEGCFADLCNYAFFKEDMSFNLKNLFQEKMIC